MRRLLPALLLLVASPIFALTWKDSIRDVYVDGVLVRNGQTLVADKLLAWIPPAGDAVVFDRATREVATVSRGAFTFADDRTSATTDDNVARRDAKPFVMPDESTLVTPSIVIRPHVSHAGAMTVDDLWTTAPVWRAIYDRYTPEDAVVKRLANERRQTTITIYFATWCGDSKRGVPRLLKAIAAAKNPKLDVQLVGIGNDFLSPMETIRDARLTNVPTIVVTRGRNELGRAVETPATTSLEGDVAAILDGTLPPHPGRYDRKRLIVSGTYDLRDARGTGKETFEIWERDDGGLLVKSTIEKLHETIETFAALDAHYRADFAEVTRRHDGHVVRMRCESDKGQWSVTTRGDESGIIEQHTALPATIVTPATATLGWPLFCASQPGCSAYVISDNALGELVTMRLGAIDLLLPASTRAPRPRVTLGAKSYELTPTSAINLPQYVRFADGSERRLTGYTGVLPRAIPASAGNE